MLVDALNRPLRDLRISVTDRCNFRCTYCMPEEEFGHNYRFLRRKEILTFEEIARLARAFARLGATRLRLTGGEPLLRPGLERLVEELAQIEAVDDLAITTNGYLLPKKAQVLKDAGLNRVNVSLDSLEDDILRRMNGNRAGVQDVLDGIFAAVRAGLAPIKINTVVHRGVNDQSVVDLVRFCKAHGFTIRFIEYMDVGTLNGWRLDHVMPAEEIIAVIDREMPLEPIEEHPLGRVAYRYRFRDGDGEVGVIASVTQPFCSGCTRLRLSADGSLYTCLFGVSKINLRDLLHAGTSDDEIAQIVEQIWQKRADRYSEIRASLKLDQQSKAEMYYIGG
jgi:cyclic pyranopterin phosphate synthase